jgi:hypothetical protein
MMRVLLLSGLLANAALASGPDDYANVVPIRTEGESAAWQVLLDTSVYAGSIHPELRDVAVFNADGQPVPMRIVAVEAADEVTEEESAAVALLPLPARSTNTAGRDSLDLVVERDADGRLRRIETRSSTDAPEAEASAREWLLDLAAFERGIDHLVLDWDAPRDGVIAHFEVAGSDDLQHWTVLRADATLTRLEHQGARIERRDIGLTATPLRYLRLRRIDAGPPLQGLRAEAGSSRRIAGATPLHWLEAASVATSGDLVASPMRHLYALGAAVPASHIHVSLADANAVARIEVFSAAAADPAKHRWTPRASLVAFRLVQDGEVIESGVEALGSGPRINALRIDSQTPLQSPPHVVVGLRPARLEFLAQGKAPYLLAVGSATARRPDYPIEAAFASLRARLGSDWQPGRAELGDSRAQAGAVALQAPAAPFDWKRGVLWIVLIGAAAVVGGIALSLLRRGAEGGNVEREQPPEE